MYSSCRKNTDFNHGQASVCRLNSVTIKRSGKNTVLAKLIFFIFLFFTERIVDDTSHIDTTSGNVVNF